MLKGINFNVQNDLTPQLIESAEKSADHDPRVLEAYIHQCTAEAQEGISLFLSIRTCLLFSIHVYSCAYRHSVYMHFSNFFNYTCFGL